MHLLGSRHGDKAPHMIDDMTLTEVVAATLATIAVLAIVWLAIDGDQSARTALTGLVGAASSYFLTPKIARGKDQGGTTSPPTA